jgi:hypothetical protein
MDCVNGLEKKRQLEKSQHARNNEIETVLRRAVKDERLVPIGEYYGKKKHVHEEAG